MRICHVITRLIVGGAQENTLLTCEGLARRGHDVTLIAGPTSGPEGSLTERARRGGYRYIELPCLVRRIDPLRDARAVLELGRLYRERRADVVHTHSSKAGIVGRLAAACARVPMVVHTIHGMSFNRTQPTWMQAAFAELEQLCATRTHRILCVADAMTRASLAAGVGHPHQYVTVYSGMEVSRFDPAVYDRAAVRRQLGFAEGALVVATVARLFRNKGYEQLLPVMERVAAERPELRFLWVGDGAQRRDYEAELARRGLRSRTTLTGLAPPEQLPELLSAADMLVHASMWEGLPRAVVQALLMEVPAICFDLDGAPEVVRSGETGLLVPPGDSTALARAILELAGSAERRRALGRAGRRLCRERFDHVRMVDAIEAVYREGPRGV